MKFIQPALLSVTLAAGLLVASGEARAQTAGAKPGAATVETDPIDCWWRTSATAVRIGEPFSFVLTCSVVENDSAKVVPDQSALEPQVMQMTPFEVIGGTHGPDLHTADRRFFQYDYRLRLIGEDLFGKDVSLPALKLSYKVQSKMSQGSAIEGRDRVYTLPPESIRVLSLVPADATTIREGAAEDFTAIDGREFKANALLVGGGVVFALAALMGVLALVKVVEARRRQRPVSRGLVSDSAILRGVGRELSEVESERASGWTPELAARALAATRIVGSYALNRPVAHVAANGDNGSAGEGAVAIRKSLIGSQQVYVSGSVTGERISQALARPRGRSSVNGDAASLEALAAAMVAFSTAWYQPNGALDSSALDEALSAARDAQRQAARRNSWPARRLAALKRTTSAQGAKVWAR